MRTPRMALLCAVTMLLAPVLGARVAAAFVTFESGQVRPLALALDGSRLFAVNTPDDRLEIFDLASGTLVHAGSVPVGMEPVAVAARTATEVWVVNHLSDSVSVVDVGATPPRVIQTLLVGDEPRDIVFGGPGKNYAFVTTAHRGQNGFDPQLTTPGVGRADVWVLSGPSPGYYIASRLVLFGDTPRALAVSPDGTRVYAAVFHSGNRTTALSEGVVCNGGATAAPCSTDGVNSFPGGLPAPNTNVEGVRQPETGLIVKFDPSSGVWRDGLGRNWNDGVRFSLPDLDVFEINASAFPLTVSTSFSGVGTVLFNMAVNPVSGAIYVSNTEARNEVRFEGPGIFGGSTVRGHLHEARITILSSLGSFPRHLNKHIDYGVVPSPAGVKEKSLATPTGMAVTSDGATLYVAAFGSSKVGVFSTAALDDDTFVPDEANQIAVPGGGPSGVALDEPRNRLYVLTRFDNAVSAIDLGSRAEVAHVPLYNPEPASVVAGRPFLYDAVHTSSNGEAACASCHIFGDFDSLAWDLGDPDGFVQRPNPNPIRVPDVLGTAFRGFHPLKGPMTTQSLRGLANHGPMHWRGDRTGGTTGGDPLSEDLAFKAFNVAFDGLLGRGGPISAPDMQAFTDFILQVTYPPNPIRALDNSLTFAQAAGRDFYFNSDPSDVFQPCNGCHRLDPAAGFFGSDGFTSFENEPQLLKIPHLRNAYQKVGMFGMPQVAFFNPGDNDFKSDQVRGFGFLHDGSTDTLFRFHHAVVFNQFDFGGFSNPGGFPFGPEGDTLRRQVEAFVLAFDSNLAPIVGQQATLRSTNDPGVTPRIDLFIDQASAGACDLIVKGIVGGEARGWVMTAGRKFRSDRAAEPVLTDAALRLRADPSQPLTYTCVPPGSGFRAGVDRDEDGFFDTDELDAGSDPSDPASPLGPDQLVRGKKILIANPLPGDESRNKMVVLAKDPSIRTPVPDSAGDPRCGSSPSGTVRATLTVSSATSGESHTSPLPCQNWSLIGRADSPAGYTYRDKQLDDGTVKKLVWKSGNLLKAALHGKGPTNLDYTLQPGVSQSPVDAVLRSGETRVCVRCNASGGRDGSDGRPFSGRDPDCPPPSACAGSPGGAFLD
jgi:DNA-binding beta-propeller fold protein YncE